jgi:hypothetical protein
MEWIVKMIEPIIKDCETPEEARKAVIKWGKSQHPRYAALGLMMVDMMNSEFEKIKIQPQ